MGDDEWIEWDGKDSFRLLSYNDSSIMNSSYEVIVIARKKNFRLLFENKIKLKSIANICENKNKNRFNIGIGFENGIIGLFSYETERIQYLKNHHTGDVVFLKFQKDLMISSSTDGSIKIFHLKKFKKIKVFIDLLQPIGYFYLIDMSMCSKYLLCFHTEGFLCIYENKINKKIEINYLIKKRFNNSLNTKSKVRGFFYKKSVVLFYENVFSVYHFDGKNLDIFYEKKFDFDILDVKIFDEEFFIDSDILILVGKKVLKMNIWEDKISGEYELQKNKRNQMDVIAGQIEMKLHKHFNSWAVMFGKYYELLVF